LTSRATTAARAGAVFAVTLVVLQILQQVVGAFNPRASVSALIALTAATATFALDRLRQGRQGVQERNAALDAALRFWPLRRIAEVDRRRLGVFPARIEHGEPADRLYLPGERDLELREAVKPGRLVLVLGPPRAGKSRAALEAAKLALGDEAWLIVPRDAAASILLLLSSRGPLVSGAEGDAAAEQLELFDTIDEAAARDVLRLWQAHPAYRASVARISTRARPSVEAA